MDDQNGSWRAYRLLITETQERHEDAIEKLRDEVHAGFEQLNIAVAQLKVKAGWAGAMSGLLVTVGVLALAFARKLLAG